MGTSSNTVGFSSDDYSTSYSAAGVGYMNNTIYKNNYLSLSDSQEIIDYVSVSASKSYYYSDNYIWNGSSYILETPEQLAWSDNYTNLVGKYTCLSMSNNVCSKLKYVAGTVSSKMYYLELTNGSTLEDETITFSDNITENGDGTYTLSNPVTIEKKDWYTDYGSYKNYYTCGSNEITCNGSKIGYITSTSNTSITYILGSNWNRYGNSFTWDGTNYTLVDTIEVTNPKLPEVFNNNHYTCFNSSGVCSELKYIYIMYLLQEHHIM